VSAPWRVCRSRRPGVHLTEGCDRPGRDQIHHSCRDEAAEEVFLRSNYGANADIVLDRKEQALAINEGDLVIEDNGTFVEVESAPQTFVKREIKAGVSNGINIEVVSCLRPDEKVKRR